MTRNTLDLARVLGNEAWFGDEIVTWENAPSAEDAAALSAKKAKRLDTKVRDGLRPDHAQLQLAATLRGCAAGRRCADGSCPQCGRALQRWLTHFVTILAAEQSEVGAVSLIPSAPMVSHLRGANLQETMAYVRKAVGGTGFVKWAVLCLDVSWNDHCAVARDWPDNEPRFGWRPHVYGFVKATNRGAFKAAIAPLFPATISVPVPFKGRHFDGSAYGASYALKTDFTRRLSYIDDTTGNLNARDTRLPAALDIELMRALSELGLAGRIALVGLKTTENSEKSKKSEINLAIASATAG